MTPSTFPMWLVSKNWDMKVADWYHWLTTHNFFLLFARHSDFEHMERLNVVLAFFQHILFECAAPSYSTHFYSSYVYSYHWTLPYQTVVLFLLYNLFWTCLSITLTTVFVQNPANPMSRFAMAIFPMKIPNSRNRASTFPPEFPILSPSERRDEQNALWSIEDIELLFLKFSADIQWRRQTRPLSRNLCNR